MTKPDRSGRRAAAQAEKERRWRETEVAAPISRSALQELLDFVADDVVAHGHDGSFRITESWLAGRGVAAGPVLEFLRAHRVGDDYALLIDGDPCRLFGPTAERLAWMPIERRDLEALLDEVDRSCAQSGCDHSLRFTRAFLERSGLPVGPTLMALLAKGGGCDCEVAVNVEPEAIYPGASRGRPG